MKRLSFITQFKIEFLLPFTSCRKVLGKMPDIIIIKNCNHANHCCNSFIMPLNEAKAYL